MPSPNSLGQVTMYARFPRLLCERVYFEENVDIHGEALPHRMHCYENRTMHLQDNASLGHCTWTSKTLCALSRTRAIVQTSPSKIFSLFFILRSLVTNLSPLVAITSPEDHSHWHCKGRLFLTSRPRFLYIL